MTTKEFKIINKHAKAYRTTPNITVLLIGIVVRCFTTALMCTFHFYTSALSTHITTLTLTLQFNWLIGLMHCAAHLLVNSSTTETSHCSNRQQTLSTPRWSQENSALVSGNDDRRCDLQGTEIRVKYKLLKE